MAELPDTARATADGLVRALLQQGPRPLVELEGELLFYPGQYLFHYKCPQGHEHWKLVSGATLRTAFSGEPVDSGWLPAGVVRAGDGPHGPFAVLWAPPSIQTLAVVLPGDNRATSLRVPLPGLVLLGVDTTYWVWALAGATFDPSAPAYQAPLPNVFPDGRICWGENKPPPVGADALPLALALFLGSLFNGDLVGQKCRAFPNDVRGQLVLLAERLPGREEQAGETWDAESLVSAYLGHSDSRHTIAAFVAERIVPGGAAWPG